MSRIIFKDILSEFISLDKIGGVSDNGTLSQNLLAVTPNCSTWLFYCLNGDNLHAGITSYMGFTITSIDDAVTVSALDLEDTENTLEAIQGAFDDIATTLHLIRHGNLLPYQIQALTRITQIYALEWGEMADGERQAINKMLGGKHD